MIWLAGAVAAGNVVDRYAPLSPGAWFIASAGVLLIWGVVRLLASRLEAVGTQAFGLTSLLCVFLGCLCAGGLRHHLHWSVYEQNDIGLLATEEGVGVTLRATALESPRLTPAPPPEEPAKTT